MILTGDLGTSDYASVAAFVRQRDWERARALVAVKITSPTQQNINHTVRDIRRAEQQKEKARGR